MFAEYFGYRKDIEDKIQVATGHAPIARDGAFEPEAFLGYCANSGKYLSMTLPDNFDMKSVYGF